MQPLYSGHIFHFQCHYKIKYNYIKLIKVGFENIDANLNDSYNCMLTNNVPFSFSE